MPGLAHRQCRPTSPAKFKEQTQQESNVGHTFRGLQSAHCQGSPAVDLGPALRAAARGGAAGLSCPVSSQLRAALRVSGGPCRLSPAAGWFCADPAAFSPCPQNTLSKHRVNCQLRLGSSEQSAECHLQDVTQEPQTRATRHHQTQTPKEQSHC